MPQSLSKVYVHITFSTKYREPYIDNEIKHQLWKYLAGACRALDCLALIVGGYTDHVHILCRLSRKIAQMDLLEEIKRQSSKWMKLQGEAYFDFYWQNGYGIFSVSPHEKDKVRNYIKNQESHHSKQSFKDELRTLLNKHEVEYDEKYVWD